jgi:hypothetical protein
MRWVGLVAWLATASCNFSSDFAVYCGNTGRCGVQLQGTACDSTPTTSLSVPLGLVDAGDLLVITVDRFQDTPQSLSGFTDALGTTFQPAFDAKQDPIGWTQTFFGIAPDGGADQVSANFTGVARYTDLFATAFSNTDPTPKVDATSSSQGSGQTLANPGALTTTVPDEILYATAYADNAVTSVDGGFQVLGTCNMNIVAWRVAGPPGTYGPVFTVDGGFNTTVVSFR